MFLRRHNRNKNGTDYAYWTLVESVRTERGPRQRIVGTIGKLSDLKEEEAVGWNEIGRILSGKPQSPKDLFEREPLIPEWARVDTRRVSIERLRRFGDVYLGLALWRRLELDGIFNELQARRPGRRPLGEDVLRVDLGALLPAKL